VALGDLTVGSVCGTEPTVGGELELSVTVVGVGLTKGVVGKEVDTLLGEFRGWTRIVYLGVIWGVDDQFSVTTKATPLGEQVAHLLSSGSIRGGATALITDDDALNGDLARLIPVGVVLHTVALDEGYVFGAQSGQAKAFWWSGHAADD